MKKYLIKLLFFITIPTFAQQDKLNFMLWEGIGVIGYVDNGLFLNFTGPNISTTYKNSKFILGMLPSLRFKEDTGTPKNSYITPNLGVGFTYTYKTIALQLPLYYNAKTAAQNGEWNVGLGIGLKINGLNKKIQ
jgi:hypothetical protein